MVKITTKFVDAELHEIKTEIAMYILIPVIILSDITKKFVVLFTTTFSPRVFFKCFNSREFDGQLPEFIFPFIVYNFNFIM